ncbi:MAG: isoleucine--tRNA ligase [Saprospiraceae bacterium]|nr:isoleucine--tRNA ligase [Saprospiraceae bacterium]
MYREYKGLNLPEIDKEIRQFWEKNDIFKKSMDQRPVDNSFVFYEGPPSANGKPGIHHVMSRTVKDLFCRFHTMLGQRVERKGGWDTHGLPIELAVEKELGITKDDIGTKISVEEYNTKCRETVMRYKDLWDKVTVEMGYWVDLDDPYITFNNDYIESVWYLLKQLSDKDMLYKGYTIQPYSPAAGTGLSTHELNLPGAYQEVTDTTVVAMFEVIRNDDSEFLFESKEEDVRLLAWTTTPWTLPSNTALTVGPKIDYVKIKTINTYTDEPVSVVLAEDLVDNWFGDKNQPEIISKEHIGKGKDLKDIRYEQLIPVGPPETGDAFKVVTGDFVTTEDGTGIVHTAPSFGADDMKVARENGIGALTMVDKKGKFVEEAGPLAGRYVKNYTDDPDYVNVDIDIAVMLKKENKAFNVAKYKHNYPHCWRTDKPVLYYPLDSWFIKASAMKERMVELNNTINWKPAHTGTGRFGVWLENLQDWNLSRSRFWGIPLPIWRTADGMKSVCIGSVAQLSSEIEKANEKLGLDQNVPDDLHKPYIDRIVLVSDEGQEMHRESDLIDVWFDSGSMPYAQWHYPFENEEKFRANFPADFIAEGVDQTRGWFYTLHAIASMVFDSVAYKNVVSNGLVLDKNGQKMSKSKGNAVDPFDTLETHGADATRWYMITNSNPWDNLKFDEAGIEEVKRKFFGTLYNTYSFFALYANIDGFKYEEEDVELSERPEIDQWILSALNTLIGEVRQDFSDYEPTKAGRKMQAFVEDLLSNWYVRLCRRRFWKGDYTRDKISAYQTLYTCLETLSKLMAPLSPFFSDWLFRNLNNVSNKSSHESIHLAFFPEKNEAMINDDLEQRMDYARRISSMVLSLRKKERIRVRQPLKRVLLPVIDDKFKKAVEAVEDLIKAEVNVKEIEYVDDTSGVVNKKAKPNFKTLGRRLGKHMKTANALISQMDQEEIQRFEETGEHVLVIEGEEYKLSEEDIEIISEDIPGWLVTNEGKLIVALDTNLDESLIQEGTARELVNRIQNLRKSKDFNVTDRIKVTISPEERIASSLKGFEDYIKSEVLADELNLEENTGEEFEIYDDLSVAIEVEKV